jgi:NADPH-dependent ferric siderophore reductase
MAAAHSLTAETLVSLRTPASVMSRLREHFGEHGTVSGADSAWSIELEIGVATATLGDGGISFRVEASDDTSLSFLQWSVAEHVYEFAPDEKPDIVWQGGIKPGTPAPYFREMTVVRTAQVTPLMRRVTLRGNDLERFARNGLHIRLLFPSRPGIAAVWPVIGEDGRQAWPDGVRPVSRVYTIRRIDVAAGEIDVDFVLHEGNEMPGAQFARDAKPGDVVGMTGPGGGTLPHSLRYVFAGDETALPAISRMLEELPSSAHAVAFVEIDAPSERQTLALAPGTDLRFLSRDGRPAGSTDLLLDSLRTLDEKLWEGDPYVWVGCEQTASRQIRKFLKQERRLARDRFLVAAYWRRGQAGEVDD